MNLLVIDYSITSNDDLKIITDKFGLNYDYMTSQHKKFDFYKIFIDIETRKMISYILNSNRSKVEVTDAFDFVMNSQKSYVIEKPAVELSLDAILDKISKFGITSLVSEEKEFLDQASKY
jgi:hypothetical protein